MVAEQAWEKFRVQIVHPTFLENENLVIFIEKLDFYLNYEHD